MDEDIIIGTLLGDASIPKLGKRCKSYHITWTHCMEQEKYCLWKKDVSGLDMGEQYRERYDKRTDKTYYSLDVYSRGVNLEYYRNMFYKNGVKIISKEILNKLTPKSIAVWFMDDGNLYYNGNNCHLTMATDGFDNKPIIEYFKEKYDINFKNHQKRIRLTSVKEVEKWEKYFLDYYHDSMEYKSLECVKNKYDKKIPDERKKFRNNKYKK